jgi:membrane-bound lytic murein transglycosylase D
MQLASPADLWDRIRRSYAMPNLESDLVQDREQWYATRPDYILRMTERSRKYLFHIVEELERRNMPTELALLPFIESAFNPQAVSSAKAAGMWQFMPATGKHFELTQNAFRDDRRDVLASTRAALDYLQKLYGMFGDWHLALAAYNWGEGSVGRAIAKNKKAGLGTTYLDLKMPAETRLYVPKLQAVKNILTNPDAFNANLPLIENHPFFQPVTITRDIDVALAAQLAEVTVDEFKALNPSANRPVILAAGNAQILLPWDNATTFQTNLAARNGGQLASWTVWVAPSTLKPADAAKRAGMAEADFRAVNHIPPRVLIKAGSTLLVPRGGRVENDVSVALADHGQVSLSSEITTRRTMVKAGKHDSVASLAKRYRVAASDLAGWNKLAESATFKPGQKVVLYLPSSGKSGGKVGGKSRGAGRGKTIAGASAKASSKGGTSTRGHGKSAKLKKR